MHSVGEAVLYFRTVSLGYGAYEWQAESGAVAVALVVEVLEDAWGVKRFIAAVHEPFEACAEYGERGLQFVRGVAYEAVLSVEKSLLFF